MTRRKLQNICQCQGHNNTNQPVKNWTGLKTKISNLRYITIKDTYKSITHSIALDIQQEPSTTAQYFYQEWSVKKKKS